MIFQEAGGAHLRAENDADRVLTASEQSLACRIEILGENHLAAA
jgi:hypothetical protein